MKNIFTLLLALMLFFWWLLIPLVLKAYMIAAKGWGTFAGVLSALLSLLLPIAAIFCWIKFVVLLINDIERKEKKSEEKNRRQECESSGDDVFTRHQSAYLRLLSAMIAKMAKADGRIDASEIQAAEKAFDRLGFSEIQKQLCILAFRNALNGSYSIDYYASQMVALGFSLEMRMVAYEILWEIACADGVLASEEKILLEGLEKWLILTPGTFRHFFRQRVRQSNDEWDYNNYQRRRYDSRSQQNPLDNEYEELGCNGSATDEELRNAYRILAKKLHPDVLRAQGMPEALMGKANERMARINAAWDKIKKARGLKN